jgi:23S rRNA (uracil1939-C5)-methyltransferase
MYSCIKIVALTQAYDEDRKTGLIRYVLIKESYTNKNILITIVTSSDIFPGRSEFVKELRNKFPEITTIIQNINPRKTSIVLGEQERVLFGPGYIVDELLGLKFKIFSKTFYQINPEQTTKLYSKVIEYGNFKGNEIVIDAYCGVGTIGMSVARSVKEVIGVEQNKQSVINAKSNARDNNIKNINFICDDATSFIEEIAKDNAKVDVVIMDPPRIGSTEKFLNSLKKLKPKKIIYVSCEAKTLARDVKLILSDYSISKICLVDMFVGTYHVETVVLLSHKKPDDFISIKMDYSEDRETKPDRVTYKLIQQYIESKYGFKVHTAYIAEVKRSLGLPMYDAPNAVEKLKHPYKPAPQHKVEAIKDALKHFKVIE